MIQPALAQQWRVEDGPGAVDTGMAHDPTRDQLVAFAPTETWVHDGLRWTRHANPPALVGRHNPMVAYDEFRRRIYLTCGGTPTNGTSDTWEWTGDEWLLRNVDPAFASNGGFMVFDASRNRLVRHGTSPVGYSMSEWNGSQWTNLGFGMNYCTGLVYDRAGGRLLGFDATSMYRWSGSTWVPVAYNVVPNPGAGEQGFVYDEARQQVLMIRGGTTHVDVLRWNGSAFVVVPVGVRPPVRTTLRPFYDARRRVVVLHAGANANPGGQGRIDTWHWDGTGWTEHTTTPPLRWALGPSATSLVFDAGRRRLVHYQAGTLAEPQALTHEWDGTRWHRVSTSQEPPPGSGARSSTTRCGSAASSSRRTTRAR